jgi:3-oxoacyl-[acyl-carrier-protein] synthase II
MSGIVVTGLGFVSALGNSAIRFWQGLLEGEDRFRAVTRFDTNPAPGLWGAEVAEFDPPVPVKAKQPWTGNRSIQFAIAAAQQALQHAGISVSDENRSQIGVVFGSTQSCLDLTVKLDQDGVVRGPRTVDPLLFPDANPFAPSCRVSLQLGLTAFNAILSNGPTSGLDAIHYACSAIQDGLAPVVLVGGVEELSRMSFLFRESMERLSQEQAPCDPFAGRGVVLGEGCAVLVLEQEQHALRRRATILAEVGGYGTCFWPENGMSPFSPVMRAAASAQGGEGSRGCWPENGMSPFSPVMRAAASAQGGEGSRGCWPENDAGWAGQAQGFAMRHAMSQTEVNPDQIDVVFASANGDPTGDRLEAKALNGLVPAASVAAVKASLGETHSAAGCFNAAACVLSMLEQTIPATRGSGGGTTLGVPLLNQARPGPVRTGLVNCFSTTTSTPAYSSLVLRAANR